MTDLRKSLLSLCLAVLLLFPLSACKKQFTLDFYLSGDLLKTLKCDEGGRLAAFSLSENGYRFSGWCDNEGERFDFSEPVSEDKTLYARFTNLVTGKETDTPTEFAALSLENAFVNYASEEQKGEIRACYACDDGFYIVARGFCGYYMPSDPYMEMGVAITTSGDLFSVTRLAAYEQSVGYPEQITEEYLEREYSGKPSNSAESADVVSGATLTSTAVKFAVKAANFYYENAIREK